MIANLHRAHTILILADGDLQFLITVAEHHLGLARLGVYIALLIRPELAVVDGAILQEGNLPVALLVAPIRGQHLLPALFHRLDALKLEGPLSVALDEVEHLRTLGQRWKMEHHIGLEVLACLELFVEFDTVGLNHRKALVTHLQIGVFRKPEPVAFIVRTLLHGDIHHRLVGLQLHLRQVQRQIEESVAIAGAILNRGLLPHNVFSLSLPRQSNECKQHG